MLKKRVITAAVGVPILICIIWFGNPWFSIIIAAATLAGTFEFYRMAKFPRAGEEGERTSSPSSPPHSLSDESSDVMNSFLVRFGLLWSLATVLSPLALHYKGIDTSPTIMASGIVISLIWILRYPLRDQAFRKWAWMVAGVIYIGWMLGYWINLRILEDGRNWVYLAMLTTFANDTGAFFTGRKWGKHSLAPTISPGKTLEGALGGLLSSVLAVILLAMALNSLSPFVFAYWQMVLLGFLVSLFAQLGDLVESLLKRNMRAKDSGNLLPGHGGVLDRFDSLIFAGAVVYYYVSWIA